MQHQTNRNPTKQNVKLAAYDATLLKCIWIFSLRCYHYNAHCLVIIWKRNLGVFIFMFIVYTIKEIITSAFYTKPISYIEGYFLQLFVFYRIRYISVLYICLHFICTTQYLLISLFQKVQIFLVKI